MNDSILVQRKKHTSNYTVYGNEMLRDRSLTWGAQGLLTYLLSLHPEQRITLAYLAMQRPNGRDATRRAIAELEATGYLTIKRIQDAKGRFAQTVWDITECPQEPPETGFPNTDNLPPVSPATEEQLHTSITKTISTKKIKTTTSDHPANITPLDPHALIMPSHLSTNSHQGAIKIIADLPLAEAQLLLDELEDALERKAIKKTPLQWLAGIAKRHKSGHFTPAGALRIASRRASQRASHTQTDSQPTQGVASQSITGSQVVAKIRAELRLGKTHGPAAPLPSQ